MISAFGPQASRYARFLGNLDAVVAEIDAIGEAYFEAVRRRESGRPFYGMVLVDDPRVAFGYRHGNEILAQIADYDRRRLIADQLVLGTLPVSGTRVDTMWTPNPVMEGIAVEFLALSDAVLVRSCAEIARINDAFARTLPRRPFPPTARILADSPVPHVERVRPERPGVVVWGPYRPALEVALHLHGLAEFHGELTCVCAGGPQPAHATATFLSPGEPGVDAALSRAAAVVCIEPNDPSDAVAFARLGYGVVAPITSGAHEFAADVVTWDALDGRFLATAVAVAVTRPAAVRSEPERPPAAPRPSGSPPFGDGVGPLVSIVTPTSDRVDELRERLACLASQTYANIESVVVNDGGAPVGDVVAEFPFARVVELPVRVGAEGAFDAGRAQARGEYIGTLPDDVRFYPNHIERLVDVLVRSGAKVAHAAGLVRYLERDPAGSWQTIGFNNRTFASSGGHQVLVHRSVYDAAPQHYFDAFAGGVTTEFRDRGGGQGLAPTIRLAPRTIPT